MLKQIEKILDTRVRPSLYAHRGDVQVQDFKDGILIVTLLGQCSSCPSAISTVEDIIRMELMNEIPEIQDVKLDIGVDPEMMAMARKIINHEL